MSERVGVSKYVSYWNLHLCWCTTAFFDLVPSDHFPSSWHLTITCDDQADSMGILMAGDRVTKVNGTQAKNASVLSLVSCCLDWICCACCG